MPYTLNDRVPFYIHILRELKRHYKIYDIHLHAVEIILNLTNYRSTPGEKGLFSLDGSKYIPPSIKNIPNDKTVEKMTSLLEKRPEMIPMIVRKTYSHTGPKVFKAYFDTLGVDKGLLLPVAPLEKSIEPQMSKTLQMFKDDPRFCMAGSVPNTIENKDVETFLKKQIELYRIIAVKIHPNITGINIQTNKGKERIYNIICSSSRLGLPIIIHGGLSYISDKNRQGFSAISNLKEINYRSSTPIIIAHGGAYGYSITDVLYEIIPVLKKLLNSNDNVFVDVSALNHEKISAFLQNIGAKRILFGSDALYVNQILMIMRLMFAIENSRLELESTLIKILSENPAKYIFEKC